MILINGDIKGKGGGRRGGGGGVRGCFLKY